MRLRAVLWLLALSGGEAIAAGAQPRAALTYEREDARCPDEAALRSMIESKLGYPPFDDAAPLKVTVRVSQQGDGLRALIRTEGPGEPPRERIVSSRSRSCRDLAEAVAFAVSLVVGASEPSAPSEPPVVDAGPPHLWVSPRPFRPDRAELEVILRSASVEARHQRWVDGGLLVGVGLGASTGCLYAVAAGNSNPSCSPWWAVPFSLMGLFQFLPFATPEDALLARFTALSPTPASDEELASIVMGIRENAQNERVWRHLAGWTTLGLGAALGVVAIVYAIVAQSPGETITDRQNRQETALQEATFAAAMGLFGAVHLLRQAPSEQALMEVEAADGTRPVQSLRLSLGATRTGGPEAVLTGRF
jgi:hypothetical protein